jgi:Flp pilus assembly protein TadG
MSAARRLRRDADGSAAVEFALVAGIFLPLCLASIDAGLLLWTKGVLQSTAALTARCAAISSSNCTNAQQFAVTTAATWLFSGIITASNVTPAPATVCIGHLKYMKVTISCNFWAGSVLPPPMNGITLSTVAYYPVGATAC